MSPMPLGSRRSTGGADDAEPKLGFREFNSHDVGSTAKPRKSVWSSYMSLNPSAVESSVSATCRAVSEIADCHILYGVRPESPDNFIQDFPLPSSSPLGARDAINPLRDQAALRELLALVAKISPDVIHAHSSKAGGLVRLAFPHGKIPILYSPRGYSFLRRDIRFINRNAYWLIEKALGALPHITIGCGLGEYSLARRVARSALHIPNMVDLADFNFVPNPTAADPGVGLRVVTAGGIRPQKNFAMFCNVAASLPNIQFLWIGGGDIPEGVVTPKNVRVTGWLSRTETLSGLSASHVYIQTSLWEELPLAMLEAMALGLPVLAKPCVGNTELLIEGENGFLCGTAESFIGHLVQLDRERQLIAEMGAASRRLVEQNHSLAKISPRWRSLYRYYQRYKRHG
ncbi:Glycosyltransferase involved in cell wall bisynthesis [Azospirillaceae bacterium]